MPTPDNIRLLVCDIDGVLTDGSIFIADDGLELRRFHVRDGLGIKLAQSHGLMIGVISGRCTRSATLRLHGLGIRLIMQGQKDKGLSLQKLCEQAGVPATYAAFLGDDLIDLPALQRCGYPMAVADAVEEVRKVSSYVTHAPGGRGAVREAIEHLLKAQGKWSQVVVEFNI
ncbi:MAG: HAD-IIIA family hydrolase [Phycisphaerales bacterium]|nr:HAD-IIIA family hydrolase [Phycisphaerales bacterium]